jgi:hypothetical protein
VFHVLRVRHAAGERSNLEAAGTVGSFLFFDSVEVK